MSGGSEIERWLLRITAETALHTAHQLARDLARLVADAKPVVPRPIVEAVETLAGDRGSRAIHLDIRIDPVSGLISRARRRIAEVSADGR